jgi:predicted DNA-binding protein (MmcQ/YjbR family)
MFDASDPWLHMIRSIAFEFPDAAEKISHGRPAFYTTKVFVYYGGSLKIEGEWIQHPQSVMVLTAPEERPALVADDKFFVPAYLGPSGWMGLILSASTDLVELGELIEESYRLTAGARRVARLDQQRVNR